jgi:hypothetical protein
MESRCFSVVGELVGVVAADETADGDVGGEPNEASDAADEAEERRRLRIKGMFRLGKR